MSESLYRDTDGSIILSPEIHPGIVRLKKENLPYNREFKRKVFHELARTHSSMIKAVESIEFYVINNHIKVDFEVVEPYSKNGLKTITLSGRDAFAHEYSHQAKLVNSRCKFLEWNTKGHVFIWSKESENPKKSFFSKLTELIHG